MIASRLAARLGGRVPDHCDFSRVRLPVATVVGSRSASAQAALEAEKVAIAAAQAGITVVSSSETGIDRVALSTVAAHGGTACAIAVDACQEMPKGVHGIAMGRERRRWAYAERSRWLAAVADIIIVVGAGAQSGALGVARHGMRYGVRCLASTCGEGDRLLLAEGAWPLTVTCLTDSVEAQIAAMVQAPTSIDDIVEQLGARRGLAAITALEESGAIVRTAGGQCVATHRETN